MTDMAAAGRSLQRAAPALLTSAVPAGAWAVPVGIAVVAAVTLPVWAADPHATGGPAGPLRAAVVVWLAAHRVALSVPGGHWLLAPLGMTAGLLALLARAGRFAAARCDVRDLAGAAGCVAAVAVPYAALAAVLGRAVASPTLHAGAPGPLLGAGLLAVLGAGYGVLAQSGLAPTIYRRLPGDLRRCLRAAVPAIAALLGAGALLTAVALMAHAGRVGAVAASDRAGLVGSLALLLAGAALLPNAVLAGLSYLCGPGFAVGAVAVSPLGGHGGALPAVPLLAAVGTGSGSGAGPGAALLALPVLAGVLTGVMVVRGRAPRRDPGLRREAQLAAGAAAVVALAVTVLAAVAGGSGGPGALATTGPSPWQLGLAVLAETALPAAACVAVCRWRGWLG